MAGVLYDVWFTPSGRFQEREKLAVTTMPEDWLGEMGRVKLDALVRERFGVEKLIKASNAKIVITSRPDISITHELRWCP